MAAAPPSLPASRVTLLVTDAEPGDAVFAGAAGPHGESSSVERHAAVRLRLAGRRRRRRRPAPGRRTRRSGSLCTPAGIRLSLSPGGQSTLAVARDLCERAEPGQVLCSGVVAGLLSGRPRLAFAAVGGVDGDGGGTAAVVELRTERGGGPISSPAELIGRQAETARLVERLQETANREAGS